MQKVSRLRLTRPQIPQDVPAPQYNYEGDRHGILFLDPAFYSWAVDATFVLITLGRFAQHHLHAVDLGSGAALAYAAYLTAKTIQLRFLCEACDSGDYPAKDVRIVGRVEYICMPDDVIWDIRDAAREKAIKNIYDRPVVTIRA